MSAETRILNNFVSSARRAEMPPHVFEFTRLRSLRFDVGARGIAVPLSGAARS